jgi:hypothetical protein
MPRLEVAADNRDDDGCDRDRDGANQDDADCDGDACGDAVSNADADAVVADVVVAIAVPVFDNALLFRLGRSADEYSRDPERLPIMSGRN